jgi:hypothetical protein
MAVEDIFREALDEFLAREFALVRKNAHEQSFCGRLAAYSYGFCQLRCSLPAVAMSQAIKRACAKPTNSSNVGIG